MRQTRLLNGERKSERETGEIEREKKRIEIEWAGDERLGEDWNERGECYSPPSVEREGGRVQNGQGDERLGERGRMGRG